MAHERPKFDGKSWEQCRFYLAEELGRQADNYHALRGDIQGVSSRVEADKTELNVRLDERFERYHETRERDNKSFNEAIGALSTRMSVQESKYGGIAVVISIIVSVLVTVGLRLLKI